MKYSAWMPAALAAICTIAVLIAEVRSMRSSCWLKRASTCCWYWAKLSFQAANCWSV